MTGAQADVLAGVRLERTSTAQRVADELQALILRGELRAGEPLRETAVAGALGVARNTVREAFRLLGHDGLVVHQMHRGVTVRRLAEQDVRDMFRARRALTREAIRSPAVLQPETLRSLRGLAGEASAAVAAEDWREALTGNLRFHRRLVACLGSRHVDDFFERLLAELRLGLSLLERDAGELRAFVSENERLCELLEADDRPGSVALVERYLDESERVLVRLVTLQERERARSSPG